MKIKKLLSLLISLAMVMSFAVAPASAEVSGLSGEAPEEQVAATIENNNKAGISLTVYNDGAEGISIEGPAGTTLSSILNDIYSWMDMGLVFGTGEDISFVINIYEDSTDAETATIKYPVTINGNGHTISYTGTNRAIEIPNETGAVAVVINDLTVDCTASYCQRGINYNATGSLALDNVTVKGENLTYALNLPGKANNCTVTIKDSDISGCIALNVWGSGSTITATNTKFASVDNAEHENYSAVMLNNDGTTSAEGSVIEIVGGSISANDDSNVATNMTETGKINISETTTVDGDIVDMAAIVIYEGATDFYACTTLQNAMDQAANDPKATVKLIRDITLSESVTVEGAVVMDLNGKTITGTDSATAANFNLFVNKGNFTIKDTAENGKITLTATTNRYWNNSSSIVSNQGGTLVLDGGYLEHLGGTDMAYVIDNNSTLGETVTTVNGGTLVSPYRAIRLFQNHKTEDNIVNVNDGAYISARAGIWMQQTSKTSVASGTLNITGGEIACISNAVVIDICGAATSDVNISGGKFSNTNENANLLLIWPLFDMASVTDANASMNITGGDFDCAGEGKLIGILDGAEANGDVVISGGTYSEDVSAYCAEGFTCEANQDGTYGIVEAEEPTIMQKMLVVYNMDVQKNQDVEYYPIHVYSGIDSLKYNEVGYKIIVTDMDKNESKEKTESTNVVYRNMKVTQTDGTVKNYDAKEALGGTYMFGHEMLFTKGTWTNANTKISVTPYAKKLDGNYVWGKEVVLTDAAVKAKDKNSALFREEKN